MEDKESIKLFVPGRLCLFGEHSDWAGQHRIMNSNIVPGHAIVTGIEQGIFAIATKSEKFDFVVNIPNVVEQTFSCEMDTYKLKQTAKDGGYFSYVAGVASYVNEWYRVGGVKITITEMTLPIKSGLSSSAAICVLVAKAFNELYKLHMNTSGVMHIAYMGEQRTPSRCGKLDQACAYGIHPISMVFDGTELETHYVTVKETLYYVFADLMSHKDTVKILADLNSGYPFPITEKDKRLHEALGEDNQKIIKRAIDYMASGQVENLGKLMREAQQIFDTKIAPKCIQELKAPVLHRVLADKYIMSLTYGAKGVGSQGDGTVQFLVKDEKSQKQLMDYLQNVQHMTTYKLTLQPNSIIRKAVIPVAGFGTRLYPETRGVKKEFCPVIDSDGLVKPAILVLLEELDAIDIDEICLIIDRDEQSYYEDFFMKPLSLDHFSKLSKQMQDYETKINRIAGKLRFEYQDEKLGFGHAVYQARRFTEGEPVLMLLGDTIYQSHSAIQCTKQLINTFDQYGIAMVAVHEISLSEVNHYGIFAGNWENNSETVMKCERIMEKPTKEYAKEYLGVTCKQQKMKYFAAFGAYILTKDVFEELGDMLQENRKGDRPKEAQMTDCLASIMEKKGLYAYIPDGESFDIGNAEAYRKTVANFGNISI